MHKHLSLSVTQLLLQLKNTVGIEEKKKTPTQARH